MTKIKTLWALEPFHQTAENMRSMYELLGLVSGGTKQVHAGFVVTHTEPEFTLAFNVPKEDRFSSYPLKLTLQAVAKAGLNLPKQRLHVVDDVSYSTTKAVDKLLALGKKERANLIGVFTHGRKGYERWMIGSFAETAIHRSNCHLLVLKPDVQVPKKIKDILFAIDLQNKDRTALKQVIGLAKRLGAKLTVFHHAEPIWSWSLNETASEVTVYRKKITRQVKALEDLLVKAKVKGEVVVSGAMMSTPKAINQHEVKIDADLVVVEAKTGRFAALMGGSITRQVIREASVPILVLKGKGPL